MGVISIPVTIIGPMRISRLENSIRKQFRAPTPTNDPRGTISVMSQWSIFTKGLAILALLLFGLRMYIVNGGPDVKPKFIDAAVIPSALRPGEVRRIDIHARRPGWTALGKGPLELWAHGTIDAGGFTAKPDRSSIPGDNSSISPELPYGVLLAKVGEDGHPFKAGIATSIASTDVIYLAINDSNYEDNSGKYRITARAPE
ncbi:MAG: hypothetical protein WBD22_07230 [Pyrinomonadaceae bacterium]